MSVSGRFEVPSMPPPRVVARADIVHAAPSVPAPGAAGQVRALRKALSFGDMPLMPAPPSPSVQTSALVPTSTRTEPLNVEYSVPSKLQALLRSVPNCGGLTRVHGSIMLDSELNAELDVIAIALGEKGDTTEKTKLKDKQKLALLEYRFLLTKAFESAITKLKEPKVQEAPPQTKTSSKVVRGLRHVFYWVTFTVGLFIHGVSGFFGVRELLSVVHASQPVSIACYAVSIIIEAMVFYAFEGGELRRALGNESVFGVGKFIALDKEFLATMENVYELMGDEKVRARCPHAEVAYSNLMETLNAAVTVRQNIYKNPPEVTRLRQFLQTGLILLGAVTHGVGAYFLMTAIVATCALAGTPLGWVLIGSGILASLVFYFVMEGRGIIRMVSPGAEDYEQVQREYERFKVLSLHKIQAHARVDEAPDGVGVAI